MAVDDDFAVSVVSGMKGSDDVQMQLSAAGLVKILTPGGFCEFCKDSLSRIARGM